jgi:hypothetical protein
VRPNFRVPVTRVIVPGSLGAGTDEWACHTRYHAEGHAGVR